MRAEVLAAVLAEHGDPRLPQRFWAKVSVAASGCWQWDASVNGDGYGLYFLDGRVCRAHRVAYLVLVGPIPDGLVLDHLCRVTNCVRPDHLEPVTSRENSLRGEGIPARHARATHCPRSHPYDVENTYFTPDGRRFCRACCRRRKRDAPKPTCPDCGIPQAQLPRHRRRAHAIGDAS